MKALHFPLTYVKEHQIKIMITDYKDLEVVPEATNQWLLDYWFPTVVAHGLIAEIVLGATEFIGQLSVEIMYESVSSDTGLITPMANNIEEAKNLAQQILAMTEA